MLWPLLNKLKYKVGTLLERVFVTKMVNTLQVDFYLPFPSCCKPLFQSKTKCEAIDMKKSFFHARKVLLSASFKYCLLFIVLFAISCTKQKNKSNYLNSHGEEAQEKPLGL